MDFQAKATIDMLNSIFSNDFPVNYAFVQKVGDVINPDNPRPYMDLFTFIKTLDYNEFKGDEVVKKMYALLPSIRSIRFGREYSPVMYIIPFLLDKNGKRLRGCTLASRIKKITTLFRNTLNADEVDVVNPETKEIRVWWD